MTLDSLCIHWWMIGDHSIGHCKKCGAIRDFEKLRLEEQARQAIHRSKMHRPVVSVL
jgi:Fe2+ or Zn2+ uptake regulation protein